MGRKLKLARQRIGLKQKDVAERLGLSGQAISSHEAAGANPNAETLMKLSGIYGESVDYWLGLSNDDALVIRGLNEDEKSVIMRMVELIRTKNEAIANLEESEL